jgi:cytoskeletal protein CcmA (bactofilin family)
MAADKETIIGVETRISGEIRGEEDLVIRGRVDGKIQLSQTLTVEKGAIVEADVDVRTLVVSGTLVGNIVASEVVRLLAGARVVGDLASPRVVMESGAAYRGRVDMGDIEAARAAVATHATVARPAAAPADAARARPAPPRMAAPPRTVSTTGATSATTSATTGATARATVAPVVAPPRAAPKPAERPALAEAAHAAPPAFPRVAGVVGGSAPAWAKKKIRRR